jgi:hypothetical protein
MKRWLSIITAHFFAFDWTELLIRQINTTTDPDDIREIIIINQDRTEESHRRLEKLDPKIRVVEYPKSEPHFQATGHDHSAVLNQAINEAKGEYICLFDTDCHPIGSEWIMTIQSNITNYDAILALRPGSDRLTHPCFMVIRRDLVNLPLLFDDKLFTDSMDTGSLIGNQLIAVGKNVLLLPAEQAFNRKWGCLYLQKMIYHHQNGSFQGGEAILRDQIYWQSDYFKRYVMKKHRYRMNPIERVQFKLLSMLKSIK